MSRTGISILSTRKTKPASSITAGPGGCSHGNFQSQRRDRQLYPTAPELRGQDGKYHQYYPDFLVRKKNGEVFIVEIKSESDRGDLNVIAKEKAVQEISNINENKIKYVVLYTSGETISTSDKDFLKVVVLFISYGVK